VHTHHSGNTTIYPVSKILRESYNTPEKVYGLAKARGMDLVTVTDHDSIEGALTIADRYLTLSAEIVRLTARLYAENLAKLVEQPLNWRRELMVVCLTVGLPLTAIALAGSVIHYVRDEQFNRRLLLDLVARPAEPLARTRFQALELAA